MRWVFKWINYESNSSWISLKCFQVSNSCLMDLGCPLLLGSSDRRLRRRAATLASLIVCFCKLNSIDYGCVSLKVTYLLLEDSFRLVESNWADQQSAKLLQWSTHVESFWCKSGKNVQCISGEVFSFCYEIWDVFSGPTFVQCEWHMRILFISIFFIFNCRFYQS